MHLEEAKQEPEMSEAESKELNKLYMKLKELNEERYTDEMGQREAAFYSQSKMNDKNLLPATAECDLQSETVEADIPVHTLNSSVCYKNSMFRASLMRLQKMGLKFEHWTHFQSTTNSAT